MIAAGHTAVGVIVGVGVSHMLPANFPIGPQLVISVIAGLASHYAMDLMPHGHYDFDFTNPNPRERLELGLDLLVPAGLAVSAVIWRHGLSNESWAVVAGIFGAQMPDIVNGFRARGWLPGWRWLAAEGRFHMSTHWHNPDDPQAATREGGRRLGWSDIWQLTAVGIAVWLIFAY